MCLVTYITDNQGIITHSNTNIKGNFRSSEDGSSKCISCISIGK